jgi:hypothetical protein
VYDIMKGIYEEKYNGSNQIVLDFRRLLGDQAPTDRVIEKNPTNVLKVYKDILQYYKECQEKKHQNSTAQEMMMFPQRVQGKKTKKRLQKRGCDSTRSVSNISKRNIQTCQEMNFMMF